MTLSMADNIAFTLKIFAGVAVGFLMMGTLGGALLAGIFALSVAASYPRPFSTSFRQSLLGNWRALCLLAGLIGLVAFYLITNVPEVAFDLKAFSAGFIGVVTGELVGGILYGIAGRSTRSGLNRRTD
jgi:hypothetical protein